MESIWFDEWEGIDFKDYLGDGVYVDFDGFSIEILTSDGITKTNSIYLEPDVLAALNRYQKRILQILKEDDK